MKYLKLFWVISCVLIANTVLADDLTPTQKKFRSDVLNFLKEEGFAPYIDESDNSVTFKKEGELHWITVSGESPFFVIFRRGGYTLTGENALDRTAALLACNEVNKDKAAVKMYCTEKSVLIGVELYTRSVEDFKYSFYSNIRALAASDEEFVEKYRSFNSGSGGGGAATGSGALSVNTLEVANTDENGEIITNYGNSIYSYNSMYLKPKITLHADQAGTYTIFVKLFMPSGDLATGSNSPSGYSYSDELKVSSGTYAYTLSGWGGKDKGHWKAGTYRYEFWNRGKKIGSGSVRVY